MDLSPPSRKGNGACLYVYTCTYGSAMDPAKVGRVLFLHEGTLRMGIANSDRLDSTHALCARGKGSK